MIAVFPVRFGGLTLNGSRDAEGDRFMVTEIEGYGPQAMTLETSERDGDGAVQRQLRQPMREIVVHGYLQGNTLVNNSVWRARNKLQWAIASMTHSEGVVYFDEPTPGVPKQILGKVTGEVDLPAPQGDHVNAFAVPFTCFDPRLYTQYEPEIDMFNTTGYVTNEGNYDTFLEATLQEGHASPSLANLTVDTGQKLELYDPYNITPAGTVVNFRTRTAIVQPSGLRLYRTRYPGGRFWFPLQPGTNTIKTIGKWRLKWRSAWR